MTGLIRAPHHLGMPSHPLGARSIAWLAVAVAISVAFGASETTAAAQKRSRFIQTGFATFYGRAFDGQETASGQRFDADALVAAHRTLPFGTIVRVTNLENGRRVTVRIVDRGPFGRNRREGAIIDVSLAAARRLGMVKDGQIRARLVVVRQPASQP